MANYADVNEVGLVGNLTKDVEIRQGAKTMSNPMKTLYADLSEKIRDFVGRAGQSNRPGVLQRDGRTLGQGVRYGRNLP